METVFTTTLLIHHTPGMLWAALTQPELMVQWMGTPDMQLRIETNWNLQSPIFIRGFHHTAFENKGTVLHFEENSKLCYSHLSSLSKLADVPEHYSTLEFVLTPADNGTQLTITLCNFPTESIRKHLEFYWRGTAHRIKTLVENNYKETNFSPAMRSGKRHPL